MERRTCGGNEYLENDLVLGNPEAPIQIIVACNPYCGPCAKAHKQLDEMLERYPELKM